MSAASPPFEGHIGCRFPPHRRGWSRAEAGEASRARSPPAWPEGNTGSRGGALLAPTTPRQRHREPYDRKGDGGRVVRTDGDEGGGVEAKGIEEEDVGAPTESIPSAYTRVSPPGQRPDASRPSITCSSTLAV